MNSFLTNLVSNVSGTGNDTYLKSQIKELKDQNEALLRENEILKKFYFDESSSNKSNSGFGKIFKDVKSTFFDGMKCDSLDGFKKFLYENSIFYSKFDEEEISLINEFQINDIDWNNGKEIFILKQRLLQRNFRLLSKNMIRNEELAGIEKELGIGDCNLDKNSNVDGNINKDKFVDDVKKKEEEEEEEIRKDVIENKNEKNIENENESKEEKENVINNEGKIKEKEKEKLKIKQKQIVLKSEFSNNDLLSDLLEDCLIKPETKVETNKKIKELKQEKEKEKEIIKEIKPSTTEEKIKSQQTSKFLWDEDDFE